MHWHLTGTHEGQLLGIEPTGKKLAIDGIDHFVIRDGRVVSNFVIFDQMRYARAIGMMPPDGSGPDKALKAAFNARTKLTAKIAERRNRCGEPASLVDDQVRGRSQRQDLPRVIRPVSSR